MKFKGYVLILSLECLLVSSLLLSHYSLIYKQRVEQLLLKKDIIRYLDIEKALFYQIEECLPECEQVVLKNYNFNLMRSEQGYLISSNSIYFKEMLLLVDDKNEMIDLKY